MSDFGTGSHHRGRKEHRCEWCGETIPKGDLFYHFVGMWEGEFQNWRMHEECHEAYSMLPGIDIQDGFTPYSYKRGYQEDR